MNTTLRTPEMESKYQSYLSTPDAHQCCFCRELENLPIKYSEIKQIFQFWALMPNGYRYDRIYAVHDMLFLKRHVDYNEITIEELEEYNHILKTLEPKYHQFVRNIGDRLSQPGHYHIHLCKFI